jgi:hypothetical protein
MLSVKGLAWDGGAIEGFAGGHNSKVEFFKQLFRVVILYRCAGWFVDRGDSLQSDAHDFKGSRIHGQVDCCLAMGWS